MHAYGNGAGPSSLRLVWVYPDLLSTYGDRGNLLVLERRARLRGLQVEPVMVHADQAVPRQGDIYLLGGGEDLPQVLAARRLRADGGVSAAAARGAVIFAVCAGYQLLGTAFPDAAGQAHEGLGLLDVTTAKSTEPRAVGELAAEPAAEAPRLWGARPLPTLTGFENHAARTTLGPGAAPLGRVVAGVGNGAGDGTEGAWSGRVVGTYLHGPVLARNPALADLLLGWATGASEPLAPLGDAEEDALRAERLAAARRGRRSRWWRLRGRR